MLRSLQGAGHYRNTIQGDEQSAKQLVFALKQCSKTKDLEWGKRLHKDAAAAHQHENKYVASALIRMYMKCGSTHLAREVFDNATNRDAVTWNCLILGYVENGESLLAMDLYNKMDCEPTHVTFVAALKACAGLEKGMDIHEQVKARGLDSNILVASTLVEMYGRFGSMQNAKEIFDRMIEKDVVMWTCLIVGYVENGESSSAMDLFIKMDCEPDHLTYVAVLEACGSLTALPLGEWIHVQVYRRGLEEDEVLVSALVDFYGKCGYMAKAEHMVHSMESPNIVSWTALLSGYSSLGEYTQVFSLAEKIHRAGPHMDSVTFLCILTTCSHAGMVEEGVKYFKSMYRYGMNPSVEHYNCVVDMLGRVNRLDEALSIVKSMPFRDKSVTWRTLLAACSKWKNLEVGKAAFDALLDDNPTDAAYVLMRDIYGSSSTSQNREDMKG